MPNDAGPFQRRGSEPLAARMRPTSLDTFVGQEDIVGEGRLLRRAIEADQLSSIILWGPPGTGKTTLGQIIAAHTRSRFLTLNAVLSGVKDIREAIASAQDIWKTQRARTILFIDEVHRWNKAQQDALLPHVENGTIILIGATTENPYFEVIKPLVSRSRIFALTALAAGQIARILRQALEDPVRGYGARRIAITADALAHLSDVAQGDARSALNALELAVETTRPDGDGVITIDLAVAEESIQRRALLYDKDGDVHYDTVSAFIKSLRGSDPDAALYWMARMLYSGEDPRFIARRMLIFASEDVGMADPQALQVAAAAARAVEFVGMPECQFNLAQACIHLATAEKSNSTMAYFDALKSIASLGIDEVPVHLKDPSRDARGLGHGKGYKYPHAHREHWVAQQYLPDRMEGRYFYHPSEQGFEAVVRERLARLRQRKTEAFDPRTAVHSARPWAKWQERLHGKTACAQRDVVLGQASLGEGMKVLDLAGEGLLGWGALAEVPLGRVACLYTRTDGAAQGAAHAIEFRVDRLLYCVVGTAAPLPFAGGAFDAALARNPLARARPPAVVFAEAARVLAPGGCFAFMEHLPARRKRLWQEADLSGLPGTLTERIIAAEESLYRIPDSPYALDEESLARALEAAGFHIAALDLREEAEQLVVTDTFLERLFAPAPEGGPPSYGDRLRAQLPPEDLERARAAIHAGLKGRTLRRSTVLACVKARKTAPR